MKPYKHQEEISDQAYKILKNHGLVYLAMEERTGKTLTSILIAEMSKAENILIITKKAALKGWDETMKAYDITKSYTSINYHSIEKLEKDNFDLVIVDEAHSSGMSTYPKKSKLYDKVRKVTYDKPIIFLSATPYAESLSQIFHQLGLTKYSPFNDYKRFYTWFSDFGTVEQKWIGGRTLNEYKKAHSHKIMPLIKHLFIKYTRKDLGFEHEPKDVLHYIDLNKDTKDIYNKLLKDEILEDLNYVADTPIKLRTGLYMIEGGTLKVFDKSIVLGNTEKIDYIQKNFKKDVAIMANFVAEQEMLKSKFTNVFSSTSDAEGIDLSHIDELVVYSMNFSTAQFIQRRARQANIKRNKPIKVHFLLCKNAVSEQVYKSVSFKKQNFTNQCFERKNI